MRGINCGFGMAGSGCGSETMVKQILKSIGMLTDLRQRQVPNRALLSRNF
jgi:hypothetical protein